MSGEAWTAVVHQTACESLRAGKLLSVMYDGYSRAVEVHAVGVSKAGHTIMRVWQVRGGSVSNEPVGWKLLRLDEARGFGMLHDDSLAPRNGYKRGDKDMVRIICQL
jgi:hypothetical protein